MKSLVRKLLRNFSSIITGDSIDTIGRDEPAKNVEQVFTEIYEKNRWGGSGENFVEAPERIMSRLSQLTSP